MSLLAEPLVDKGVSAIANVLTIAGTDPSGGAGISADLKTFSALGVFGASVVTAVVAQNTRGVAAVHQVPAELVRTQLDNLLADVRIDAVKIGMLGTAEVVDVVASAVREHQLSNVVLDPVMVAKSGDRLLDADAVEALRSRLIPISDLITPNLPEAADLVNDKEIEQESAMLEQLIELRTTARGVLLKGGHLNGPLSIDLLGIGDRVIRLTAPRVDTTNTHGTGCTLSAAIAALRARGMDWAEAVIQAKDYLTGALRAADQLDVGCGHGPVHHFHRAWPATPV